MRARMSGQAAVLAGAGALAGAVLATGPGAVSWAATTATAWTVRPGGVVAVSYADTTGKLAIHAAGGTLHWYHVSGCAGLVGDGDPATLAAAYTVSPRQAITRP